MIKNVLLCLTVAIFIISCRSESGPPEIAVNEAWSWPVAVAQTDSHHGATHHSSSTGVVYLNVENRGGPDRLLRARSEVSEVVEIHQTIMEGDRMKMQHAESGLEVPGHGKLELAPSGSHIMLIGLQQALVSGDSFAVHLEFEKSGTKTVYSQVRKP